MRAFAWYITRAHCIFVWQALSQAPDEDDGGHESGGDDSDRDSGNEEPTDQDQDVANQAQVEQQHQQQEVDQDDGLDEPEVVEVQPEVEPEVVVAVNQVPDLQHDYGAVAGAAAAVVDPVPHPVEWVDDQWMSQEIQRRSPAINLGARVEPLSRRLAMLSFARPSDAISEG